MKNPRETIEAHYAAGDRGDLPGMMADFDPDIVWTEATGFPVGGTYVGIEAVRDNVFIALAKDWEGWGVSIEELVVEGDTVIALGSYSGTHRATGKTTTPRVAHVWRVRDGRIVAFEQITDSALVIDAMS